jgi:hypothetical protein
MPYSNPTGRGFVSVSAPLPATQGFCTRCGAAFGAASAFCPSCGWSRTAVYGSPVAASVGAVPAAGPPPNSSRTHTVAIVVIVVVVVAVVTPILLSFLLFGAVSSVGTQPGATPIGSAFYAGDPTANACSTEQAAESACVVAGDWIYQLVVESSTVDFGSVLFEVKTAAGAIFGNTGTGSFALVNASGAVVATSQIGPGALAMTSSWAQYANGYTPSTPLTYGYSIVVDTGQAAPTTAYGLAFVGIGTGYYSGTTGPLALP